MQNISLPYKPEDLPRELKRHYISASEKELTEMLATLGKRDLKDLFSHVPKETLFSEKLAMPVELSYRELLDTLIKISEKNNRKLSFLGDGLPAFQVGKIVDHVLGLRRLTTAYTPYQPERSQGTLATHWIYQCAIAAITGFEAVNASFYDRSTALFEALKCAQRLVKDSSVVFVANSLYPGDIEVLRTHAEGTDLQIKFLPVDYRTGTLDLAACEKMAESHRGKLAAIAFPQVNCYGNLENVDWLSDFTRTIGVRSIAVIDPILLGEKCLKTPREFGKQGTDMFVAEGQHLAIGPNFGGPGLGIFGIRYNDQCKNDIRATAGRFVGKGKDINGREAYSIVLSTREQHIRREKATSNICSNQAYIATVAGAALLERGAEGITNAGNIARKLAHLMAERLVRYSGIELAFPKTPFFNEFIISLPTGVDDFLKIASQSGIHAGIDVSDRFEQGNYLKISFSDMHCEADLDQLELVFAKTFGAPVKSPQKITDLPSEAIRKIPLKLPKFSLEQLKSFYSALAEQNVSPDENIYALGSCTMKYNPYINDFAAALPGFSMIHPQAPEADVQGALQIIYETQEYFKAITGLAAVTTQPVAGAQGELVGIKMFQAYHKHQREIGRGDVNRDVILIPRTAHGTNPATATMAGFTTIGIIEASANGEIDFAHLEELVRNYDKRVAGIMITNPNTSGIFETKFRKIADLIHSVGGLVYMDGANMNAIAGWVNLAELGVDAVHNNTHKTWTIPHGGGGPGDAFVAVSEKLVEFLPGIQVEKHTSSEGIYYRKVKPKRSIGSFHRHIGNFAHKVRCYTYLRALGKEGVPKMAAVAVLSANYLFQQLREHFPSLPVGGDSTPRMHEFILTLSKEMFTKIEALGMKKSDIIPRVGKLFLDFGLHAPTVAFPEVFGLMIEPTESYSKTELDRFVDIVKNIAIILEKNPEVLFTVPHFTPIDKVDEVSANRDLFLSEEIQILPAVLLNRISASDLDAMPVSMIRERIVEAHRAGN